MLRIVFVAVNSHLKRNESDLHDLVKSFYIISLEAAETLLYQVKHSFNNSLRRGVFRIKELQPEQDAIFYSLFP